MKLALALTCSLATSAFAFQPIVVRDLKTITDVLSSVQSGLQKVDDTLKAFNNDKAPLLQASNDLVSTLKDGKTKVDGSGPLVLTDAISLTGPVQTLTKLGQTLGTDLLDRRAVIEKLGECGTVRTQISDISSSSQGLIDAVVSKIPPEAQDIAKQLSAELIKLLKKSQDDFSESNCKNSSGGGGSPPASSAPPSGGNPSSAPAGSPSSAPAASQPASTAPPAGGASSAPAGTAKPTIVPSGAPSSPPVVITAGAAAHAPVGVLAVAIAAMLL